MMKKKETARVIGQKKIAEDIYDLRLAVSFAADCRPGQFVSLYMNDKSHLLPRPISICEIGEGEIRLVYRVVGQGTAAFSKLKSQETVEVMGPLGNGFPVDSCAGQRVVAVGGGIGVPPMVGLAEALSGLKGDAAPASVTCVAGYRSEMFLAEEMRACGAFYAAVEQLPAEGSIPVTEGNVLDAIKAQGIEADIMMACGPAPMLRTLKGYAEANGITLYVSLEEKMACGIGACLGCVCESRDIDPHSHVRNKRICKDGPVFNAEDIVL